MITTTKMGGYTAISTDEDLALSNPTYIGAVGTHNAHINFGQGSIDTKHNELMLCMHGAGAENVAVTVSIYGANAGGGAELIGTLTCSLGASLTASGGNRWVDVISATSYHLPSGGIVTATGGANGIAKVGFDAIGYNYMYFTITLGSATEFNILWRTI